MDRLQERIAQLEQTLELEREEFKSFYRAHKEEYNTKSYVDEDYYKESQYIHNLKQQIESLIQQNNLLRAKNLKLAQELEEIKHPDADEYA